jgi:serine/threonine protein kinase
MTCAKCGSPVSDGAAFCASCGAATRDPTAVTLGIAVARTEDPLLVAVREGLAKYYVIEKELGRGGMAVVYKGKEKGLEREVAIKVLPPEMALQGGTADRFRREARLAASLEHQNIIPVYRVGEEHNLIYMAMKFVRGRPLDAILEDQGALPVPVVVRILAAAASGLAHAHEHNVVHRDIKGANILIELDGRPLVADFGIARAMTENSLTASGMVIGTPNFMSPEQCGGSKVGPQSDQYSLGVLGFQMLTGQLPFEADSIMGIIQHHYMTPPPDINTVREGVPPELIAAIEKALAKRPEDRYANTSEMAEAFESVPLTPQEKRDSLALLKQLSQGEKVATVSTGTLPPLSLTASISGQRASVARPISSGEQTKAIAKPGSDAKAAAPKSGKAGIMVAAMVLLLAGGGGAFWKLVLSKPADASPPAAGNAAAPAPTRPEPIAPAASPPNLPGSTKQPGTSRPANRPSQPATQQAPPAPHNPAPAPVAAGTGTIRVSVPGCGLAEIAIDGRRVGAGRGSFTVPVGSHTVTISGGDAPFSTTVSVGADEVKAVVASSVTCTG